MAKSPNWTKEEIDLLSEVYPELGKCTELEDFFPGRTLESISLKANRIGLRVKNNVRKKRTNEEYMELLKNTNFEALEEYKGSTVLSLHRCKICAHEWLVRPQQLLKEKAQCPICSLNSRLNNIEYVDKILDEANLLRLSEYRGSCEELEVEHLNCGYVWATKFSYIQQGSGCPLCNKGFGHDYSKQRLPAKATLYLLKIVAGGEQFLKVGVTVRKTSTRVRELKNRMETYHSIEVLREWTNTGLAVLLKEKEILNKYKKYNSSMIFDGCTELLDISELDSILKEFYE